MGWINGFEPNSHCLWFQNAIKGQEIYYGQCLKAHNIIILWWWKTIQVKPRVHIYLCLKVPVGLANLKHNVLLGNWWHCSLTYWTNTRMPGKNNNHYISSINTAKQFIIFSTNKILHLPTGYEMICYCATAVRNISLNVILPYRSYLLGIFTQNKKVSFSKIRMSESICWLIILKSSLGAVHITIRLFHVQ